MARTQTIVESVTCDLCGGEGTEAFTILVDVGSRQLSKPRVVDLCDPCADPIRTLQVDVRRAGVVLTDRPAPKGVVCPLCTRELHPTSIYAHLRNVHKLPVPKQPKKCPDCGMEAVHMVRHRGAAHGYNLIDAYLKGATSEDKGR